MATKQKKQFTVQIDVESCKACGYCENVCPKKVYATGNNPNAAGYMFMTTANADACIGCGTCVMVCPDFVLTIAERGA